jgi:hypothetical protein
MVRNVDPPCMRFGFGVNWFRICHHNLPSLVVTNVTAGSRAKARRAASDYRDFALVAWNQLVVAPRVPRRFR